VLTSNPRSLKNNETTSTLAMINFKLKLSKELG
jgi:hypothetical protein